MPHGTSVGSLTPRNLMQPLQTVPVETHHDGVMEKTDCKSCKRPHTQTEQSKAKHGILLEFRSRMAPETLQLFPIRHFANELTWIVCLLVSVKITQWERLQYPTLTNRLVSQTKINTKFLELKDGIKKMDLTDTYRAFHTNTKVYNFTAPHGAFSKTGHILGHKANFNR